MPTLESLKNTQKELTKSRWLSLLLPMALVGLVLFSLMALLMNLSYHALDDLAEQDLEEIMLESASQMASQLGSELQQLEHLSTLLADQTKVILSTPEINVQPDLLKNLQLSAEGAIFSPNTNQAAIYFPPSENQQTRLKQKKLNQLTSLSPLLKDVYASHDLINLAFVNTDYSGVVVFPWLDIVGLYKNNIDIKDLEHYKIANKYNNPKRKSVWISSYSDSSSSSKVLTLSHPVILEEKLAAVVGLDVTLDALALRLDKMSVPWGGYSLLMNAEGELLVFPFKAEADWQGITAKDLKADYNSEAANLLHQTSLRGFLEPLRLDASGLLTLKLKEQTLLLSWSSVTSTGWKLLNVASADKVFKVKNQLTADYRMMLYFGAFFILLMYFLLVFFVLRRDYILLKNNKTKLLEYNTKKPVVVDSKQEATGFIELITGPLIICQFDKQGLIIACNTAFEHLAGSTLSVLKGRNVSDFLDLNKLLIDNQTNEIVLKIGQQQEAVSYWLSVHSTDQGEGLLLLLDVSECKQIQQQLLSDKQRSRLASKMKAEFLQVAVGNANILLLDLLQNARGADANLTNYCQSKLMELQHLLDDMRDMSYTGEDDKQEVAEDKLVLSLLVNDCYLASESLLANSGRRILIEYGTNIPEQLILDRRRLFRLMRHLLRQMIQLSAKGDIYFWLGWSELGRLQLKIHDQGGGLAESERLKRFQLSTPMSSNYDASSGSLGLGQLLTRQLVHEMRGSLEVRALPAGGLELQIELPAKQGEIPKRPVEGRILVVDDGPVNTMLASSVLEKSGYWVDVAASGAEALKLGLEHNYNLVLMDIFMPDMDGIETVGLWRKLPNTNAETPIIALTANAMDLERERFLREGMNDYLTKPYRPNELRELVQCWLQKKR